MRNFPYKFLIISAIIFVLDQVTKYAIWFNMQEPNAVSNYIKGIPFNWNYEPIRVFGDLVRLTHVQNSAAAFGFSIGNTITNRIFFSCTSLILVGVIFYMLKRSENLIEKISFSIIIGGAFGNILDRFLLGSVTDFLDVDFPDILMERWPIFNVADSSIVCGVILLMIWILFLERKKNEEKQPDGNKTKDQTLGITPERGTDDDRA